MRKRKPMSDEERREKEAFELRAANFREWANSFREPGIVHPTAEQMAENERRSRSENAPVMSIFDPCSKYGSPSRDYYYPSPNWDNVKPWPRDKKGNLLSEQQRAKQDPVYKAEREERIRMFEDLDRRVNNYNATHPKPDIRERFPGLY